MSINVITEPKVYVLARQLIDREELARFQGDEGVPDWSTEAESEGEEVVEVAGRLCYHSYAKPRPGGNSAYIRHILEVGHGCYDAETDVLTDMGWLPFPQAVREAESGSIRFATRNHRGVLEYQHAIGSVAAPYSGPMYRVESRGVDLLVTPNHRMYVCPTTTSQGRAKEDYQFIRADELGDRSHAYIKTATWDHDDGSDPEPAVAALLGFSIGDGNIGDRSASVRFRLRRPRKIDWLIRTAAEAGWALSRDGDRFSLKIPDRWVPFFRGIYGAGRQKQIPQHVLTRWSFYGLLALYQGLMESDGHRGRTGDSFDTTSPILAGQFQQLCLHLGVAANVNYTLEKIPAGGSFGVKPITRLSVLSRATRPEVNKFAGSKAASRWIDGWSGDVFCVQVPNGTLYVRRNGKPVWCGNSVCEHAVWTLIVTGISRSLSHELVRHRVGISPSQLSQRYVDSSDVAFVVPPLYLDDVANGMRFYELYREKYSFDSYGDAFDRSWVKRDAENAKSIVSGLEWLAQAERSLRAYERFADRGEKFAGDVEDRTLRRKRAREAARSVLPNCAETKIALTGNARAWRHLLEMRGSEHADAEFRRLALAILDVLRVEAPSLFGDYEVVDGCVRTPHPKV